HTPRRRRRCPCSALRSLRLGGRWPSWRLASWRRELRTTTHERTKEARAAALLTLNGDQDVDQNAWPCDAKASVKVCAYCGCSPRPRMWDAARDVLWDKEFAL